MKDYCCFACLKNDASLLHFPFDLTLGYKGQQHEMRPSSCANLTAHLTLSLNKVNMSLLKNSFFMVFIKEGSNKCIMKFI